MPDSRVSQVRFEALACLPWFFPTRRGLSAGSHAPRLPRFNHGLVPSQCFGDVPALCPAPHCIDGTAKPPVDWLTRYISYELTLAGGGEAISSYTIRPGTTPVARDGRFRAAFPRLRAHVPGESLTGSRIIFSPNAQQGYIWEG